MEVNVPTTQIVHLVDTVHLMDVPVISVQVLTSVPVTSSVQKTIHALVDMRVPTVNGVQVMPGVLAGTIVRRVITALEEMDAQVAGLALQVTAAPEVICVPPGADAPQAMLAQKVVILETHRDIAHLALHAPPEEGGLTVRIFHHQLSGFI